MFNLYVCCICTSWANEVLRQTDRQIEDIYTGMEGWTHAWIEIGSDRQDYCPPKSLKQEA